MENKMHRKKLIPSPCFSAISLLTVTLLTGHGGSSIGIPTALAAAPGDQLAPGYMADVKVPASSTAAVYNIGPADIDNPVKVDLVENIGSALDMVEKGDSRTFYAVTDAGLAVDCEAFAKGEAFNENGERSHWGKNKDGLLCVDEDGKPTDDGKIYIDPKFEPKIYSFTLSKDGIRDVKAIAIKGTTIIPPKVAEARSTLAGTNDDFKGEYKKTMPHNLVGEMLSHSPVGIDPEAVAVLADGSFWIGEEFGPSLLHVAADGEVIEQIVPSGTENAYRGSSHKVRFELPGILKMRKRNRGIEALAYDKTGNQLTFIMQNALANPEETVHKKSNLHRMYTLDLDENGNFAGLSHSYLYQAGPSYAGAKKQKNVRVSEMKYHGKDRFLVLERDKKNKKDAAYTNQVLYLVDLSGATNILGKSSYDDLEIKALSGKPYTIKPVKKTMLLASDTSGNSADNMMMPEGTEGFVLLNSGGDVVFISENEYGLEGRDGYIKIINIPGLKQN